MNRVAQYVTTSPEMREQARLKTFTWQALATVLLYLWGYLPGLIANFLFLAEAKRMEETAGEPLPGAGLLRFMLYAQAFLLGSAGFGLLCYGAWALLPHAVGEKVFSVLGVTLIVLPFWLIWRDVRGPRCSCRRRRP